MKITGHTFLLSTSFLLSATSACSSGDDPSSDQGSVGLSSGGAIDLTGTGGLGTGTGGDRTGGGGDFAGTGGNISGGAPGIGGLPAGGNPGAGGEVGGEVGTGGGDHSQECPMTQKTMPPERTRLIQGQLTADPSAHVFDCNLYFYPSHDQDNANSFNMVDYHVFSLDDHGSFKDEGTILHLDDVPWATQYAWAPDIAYKDGTYFFYFPAKDNQGIFRMGVATASSPVGPFTPEATPINGSFSIDPAVFTDDDGESYMYFGGQWGGQLECYNSGSYVPSNCSDDNGQGGSGDGSPRVVKMGADMKSFSGDVQDVTLSGGAARFFEGSWVHKYNGKYYFSYSDGPSHRLHYAIGASPMGPFEYEGVLLPDHGSGWTTHHSVVEFQGQWYLFYHDSSCSGGQTPQRCVKYASLTHNGDGTINMVTP